MDAMNSLIHIIHMENNRMIVKTNLQLLYLAYFKLACTHSFKFLPLIRWNKKRNSTVMLLKKTKLEVPQIATMCSSLHFF